MRPDKPLTPNPNQVTRVAKNPIHPNAPPAPHWFNVMRRCVLCNFRKHGLLRPQSPKPLEQLFVGSKVQGSPKPKP